MQQIRGNVVHRGGIVGSIQADRIICPKTAQILASVENGHAYGVDGADLGPLVPTSFPEGWLAGDEFAKILQPSAMASDEMK